MGQWSRLPNGEWAEVRTLALGEVSGSPAEVEQVHAKDLSSFSRLTDAAHFTELAEVETRRRCLVEAKEVCAVMDGADWLQPFVDMHRQDAVRILDFPHAAEHLSHLLEALSASGRVFPALWLSSSGQRKGRGSLERRMPIDNLEVHFIAHPKHTQQLLCE